VKAVRADEVIDYAQPDWEHAVLAVPDGQGVDQVLAGLQ